MENKKYFSERHGYKPSKVEIQLFDMDPNLRTALWNAMCQAFWRNTDDFAVIGSGSRLGMMLDALWIQYFKMPLDERLDEWFLWRDHLKEYIFKCEWHEVYEIIEFMMDHWRNKDDLNNRVIPLFNRALERELSGYRIISGVVTPITDEVEISEIEQALEENGVIRPVRLQLEEALRKLSNRDDPDYRGSIKDSISAVETLCRLISDEPKLELGKALKALEQSEKVKIHSALRDGFSKIYGWTSDGQGIRHGLMDEPNLTFEDAKYMLVSCSAFINYLIAKASEAGLVF
jgi:DNA-binding transcriptional ArsR family regulator